MSSEQKDRILNCACELYLAEGFDGFSMRKLARTLGVTAPALYRHFESREAVLHEVMGEAYRRLTECLFRALGESSPGERLRGAAHGYMEFAIENPRLYEVIFLPPRIIGTDILPPEVESKACAIGTFWDDRVRECIEAGVLAEGDPTEIGQTLWAHAHGLVTLHLRGRLADDGMMTDEQFHQTFRASSERLMRGLGGPAWISVSSQLDESEPTSDVALQGTAS